MKKILYVLLLAAELFIGSLFISSLWMSSLYIPVVFAIASVIALAAWQISSYLKTNDTEQRRKKLRNIAWIASIPIATFIITYIVVAIVFIIGFSTGAY